MSFGLEIAPLSVPERGQSMRRFLAISTLTALVVVACFSVRSITAQAKPAKQTPAKTSHPDNQDRIVALPGGEMVEISPEELREIRLKAPFSPEPTTRGARSVNFLEVVESDGSLYVAGIAHLYDRDKPMPYVWHASITRNGEKEAVFDNYYTEDMFVLYPGKVESIIFMDSLHPGLPPESMSSN